jgi:XFP N-terminal domain
MTTPIPTAGPLDPERLTRMDAYWRASLYLGAGMVYLRDNPLLKESLQIGQIKKRLLGHWGSDPGHPQPDRPLRSGDRRHRPDTGAARRRGARQGAHEKTKSSNASASPTARAMIYLNSRTGNGRAAVERDVSRRRVSNYRGYRRPESFSRYSQLSPVQRFFPGRIPSCRILNLPTL